MKSRIYLKKLKQLKLKYSQLFKENSKKDIDRDIYTITKSVVGTLHQINNSILPISTINKLKRKYEDLLKPVLKDLIDITPIPKIKLTLATLDGNIILDKKVASFIDIAYLKIYLEEHLGDKRQDYIISCKEIGNIDNQVTLKELAGLNEHLHLYCTIDSNIFSIHTICPILAKEWKKVIPKDSYPLKWTHSQTFLKKYDYLRNVLPTQKLYELPAIHDLSMQFYIDKYPWLKSVSSFLEEYNRYYYISKSPIVNVELNPIVNDPTLLKSEYVIPSLGFGILGLKIILWPKLDDKEINSNTEAFMKCLEPFTEENITMDTLLPNFEYEEETDDEDEDENERGGFGESPKNMIKVFNNDNTFNTEHEYYPVEIRSFNKIKDPSLKMDLDSGDWTVQKYLNDIYNSHLKNGLELCSYYNFYKFKQQNSKRLVNKQELDNFMKVYQKYTFYIYAFMRLNQTYMISLTNLKGDIIYDLTWDSKQNGWNIKSPFSVNTIIRLKIDDGFMNTDLIRKEGHHFSKNELKNITSHYLILFKSLYK